MTAEHVFGLCQEGYYRQIDGFCEECPRPRLPMFRSEDGSCKQHKQLSWNCSVDESGWVKVWKQIFKVMDASREAESFLALGDAYYNTFRHWDGTSSLLSHFSWLSSIRQRSLQGTTGASTLPLWSSTCFDYHHEIWCPRHLKDKDSCQHYLLSASEKPAKVCCCRSLLVRRSFVLKVAPNHGKRMKAIWWTTKSDTLQYLEIQLVHSCLHAKLGIVPCFPHSRQSQSDTRSDTLAIPFWYINAHKSILSPHGFPLVEFQLWTCKKRSRDVRHTWLALSKNPQYEPVKLA